jgi:hypothetical protein
MDLSQINVRDRDEIPSFPSGGGERHRIHLSTNEGEKDRVSFSHQVERRTENPSVTKCGGERQIIQLPLSVEEKDIESICHQVKERKTENPSFTK